MKTISSSETPVLRFSKNQESASFTVPRERIAWLHTIAERSGATFDIAIADKLGRKLFEKRSFGGDTERAGELVNLPFRMGEEVNVSVKNLSGAEYVDILLN